MNQNTQQGSISSSDLIDAKLEEHKLCGSKHCPGCGHKLETKPDWVGLPAGVKFDPTDQELIEHLEAKVEAKEFKSHPLIDEFIPTIEGEDGICYTHPEKLPGVTRDGLSKHFFHRPSKAYTTGTRKRRKIQTETDLQAGGDTRWHKTGKTRPVMLNGKQKGCKKILVLYTNFGKNRKPEKTNWVMHQYHLGQHEEEKEGELVVSKIFYQTQPRQSLNAAVSASGEANSDLNKRSEASGSGSCSSSKEIIAQTDDFSGAALNICAPIPSYTVALDHHIQQQMKVDSFAGYLPFGKTFHEAGLMENVGEASSNINAGGTCQAHDQMMGHEDHQHHHQQQHQIAYHINRPSYSISNVVSPSTMHHHSSMIIDEADHSFLVPKVMQLPNPHLQQEQHHKVEGRSASGLEELIMGCTSTHADTTKQESSSMVANNPQHEAEWLKYSTFWPDPDHNPDHHG